MRRIPEILANAKSVKYLLTRLGEWTNERTIYNLNAAINYLEVGRWMRAHGYDVRKRFTRREQLFDLIGAEAGDKVVLYMEFGVHRAEATRYWSKVLRNPRSELHGFDSFEGLPEDWNILSRKGAFSVDGEIPVVDDPRVRFFKGWFDQTLPKHDPPPYEVLVLNLDADLYSSTIFVLDALKDRIVPGTYVYFDEINDRMHELRAFNEFIRKTKMTFSLLGVTRTLKCALFKRVS
jgi:O-methyltransferase